MKLVSCDIAFDGSRQTGEWICVPLDLAVSIAPFFTVIINAVDQRCIGVSYHSSIVNSLAAT